jgi:two-component system phosphate regulon response regulator OmpR
MDKPAILVVDDDARLRSLLCDYLSDQDFFVCEAHDAAAAREKLDWIQFDAMVLDRMMPGETGLELAQDVRGDAPPILMLTAMGESADRIAGLEAGVADYLTKPFEPRELVLRLQNLLAKQTPEPTEYPFGPYRYDAAQQRLWHDQDAVYITSREAELLSLLASHRGTPVSREQLAAAFGQSEAGRAVDVQINRLRKKIEPDPSKPIYIQTVRGEGYRLT